VARSPGAWRAGNVFGVAALPSVLGRFRLDWLTQERNVMTLAFTIGVVHLTLAHAWNVVRFINSTRALVELGWIATTWTMYFLARQLVLGDPFPAFAWVSLGVGVVLIALFITPWRKLRGEWFTHAMLPLNLVSNFVDVVSYVRLFAVGAATFAVAEAFNDLAASVGLGGPLGGVLSALVLFFGHTLNVLLAAMGVLGARRAPQHARVREPPGPVLDRAPVPPLRALEPATRSAAGRRGRRTRMEPRDDALARQAGAAAVLGLAAIGSAVGTGTAGLAAVGVWKRCYALDKPVPFILVTFIGAPLSQTIYGMILMNAIVRVATERAAAGDFVGFPAMMAIGLFGGAGMAASAAFQGRVGAAAADALGETGKGWATTSWRSASSRRWRCSCWCSSRPRCSARPQQPVAPQPMAGALRRRGAWAMLRPAAGGRQVRGPGRGRPSPCGRLRP
jgi:F0F1-type ATP synthase membrane subunit c/vacuolar-type H+-ATPase subunit K